MRATGILLQSGQVTPIKHWLCEPVGSGFQVFHLFVLRTLYVGQVSGGLHY